MIRTLNNNSSNSSNILGSVRGSSVSCSICDDVTTNLQSLSNSKYMDEPNNHYFDVVDIEDDDNDLRNDSRNRLQSSQRSSNSILIRQSLNSSALSNNPMRMHF